jgi:hypothetical protein
MVAMRIDFAPGRFVDRNGTAATNPLHKLIGVFNNDSFVGVAIFSGIGLLAGLTAAFCGIPGIWL